MVRPGGKLALSTWAKNAFQPEANLFGTVIRSVKSDLTASTRPWERLTDAAGLQRLFADAGVAEPVIHTVEDQQALSHPHDWWTIAMGSGFRGEIEQLDAVQRMRLEELMLRALSKSGTTATGSGALYALAQRKD